MARRGLWLLIGLLAAGAAPAAELYRWVDAEGKVHYTDTPPPPSAKSGEEKRLTPSVIQSTQTPYATREAAKNFPVTLYISDCGETCDQAKNHLARRGIPFTTKNANDPAVQEEMRKQFGVLQVPILVVGKSPTKGYESSAWDAALDAAGYPRSAALPPLTPASPKAEPPTSQP